MIIRLHHVGQKKSNVLMTHCRPIKCNTVHYFFSRMLRLLMIQELHLWLQKGGFIAMLKPNPV